MAITNTWRWKRKYNAKACEACSSHFIDNAEKFNFPTKLLYCTSDSRWWCETDILYFYPTLNYLTKHCNTIQLMLLHCTFCSPVAFVYEYLLTLGQAGQISSVFQQRKLLSYRSCQNLKSLIYILVTPRSFNRRKSSICTVVTIIASLDIANLVSIWFIYFQ